MTRFLSRTLKTVCHEMRVRGKSRFVNLLQLTNFFGKDFFHRTQNFRRFLFGGVGETSIFVEYRLKNISSHLIISLASGFRTRRNWSRLTRNLFRQYFFSRLLPAVSWNRRRSEFRYLFSGWLAIHFLGSKSLLFKGAATTDSNFT